MSNVSVSTETLDSPWKRKSRQNQEVVTFSYSHLILKLRESESFGAKSSGLSIVKPHFTGAHEGGSRLRDSATAGWVGGWERVQAESPRKRLAWHLCLSRATSPGRSHPTLGCLVSKGCLESGLDLRCPGLQTPKKHINCERKIGQLWRGLAVSLQGLIRRLKDDCSPEDSLARVLGVLSGVHQAALITFSTGAATEAQRSQFQLCPALCHFLSHVLP